MQEYAWLIPLFPLLGAALVVAFGRRSPARGGWISLGAVGLGMVLALLVAHATFNENNVYVDERVWFEGDSFAFEIGVYLDNLAALMLVVVSIVSFLVVVYSQGYMAAEGDRRVRYFAEINLFVGVMLGLVIASNFLQLFIFWELVGLCSYLLIGFWYEKPSAASAAKKAFLVTRVGDVFLLLGLVIIYDSFGSLNFSTLIAQLEDPAIVEAHSQALTRATFCIFLGAVGKSAQFPLHVWLPDAMEGPTTVSALIHAATMVNAGVYLVARAYPLLVHCPDTLLYIAVTGGFTAFIAAAMAMVMYDIKRVLAYSTISQLGYMFLALGAGGWAYWHAAEAGEIPSADGYTAGLLHLMNHAFFKALLFLGAGSVIHAAHTQDLREMGGLRRAMPITSTVMGLAVLSIAGFPPFSGFWSKDLILESVFENGGHYWLFRLLWIMAMVTAVMTAFYMARLWYMAFSGPDNEQAHESPRSMTIPLIILVVLAVGSGAIALMLPTNSFTVLINFTRETKFNPMEVIEHIFFSYTTYLSILATVLGLCLGWWFYAHPETPDGKPRGDLSFIEDSAHLSRLHEFLGRRLRMAALFDWIGLRTWDTVAWSCDRFDHYIIDGFVNGLATLAERGGERLRRVQTGFTGHYASLSLGGLAVLVLLLRYLVPLTGWSP